MSIMKKILAANTNKYKIYKFTQFLHLFSLQTSVLIIISLYKCYHASIPYQLKKSQHITFV